MASEINKKGIPQNEMFFFLKRCFRIRFSFFHNVSHSISKRVTNEHVFYTLISIILFLPKNENKKRMIKREENGITNKLILSMKKEENCWKDVENNPVYFSE